MSILFIGAGIWLYCYLRDKHNECTLSRQIKQFKGDVKHIAKEADPKRLVHNAEVRHAMNTISDYVHDIPCTLSRQIKQFKGDVKHIAKEADPKRLVHNAEVRHAMNTISDYVHDIPGHVGDAASRVRDAITD